MITYLDTLNTLHTRGMDITLNDYIFALSLSLGEEDEVAYAIAYEPSEFNKNVGTEDEREYLASLKRSAEATKDQQQVRMLLDLFEDALREEVQAKALNLEDYKFSGAEAVKILNNLLKTRVNDLESSSVRDIVALIKTLTEQGALEVGDGGFSKHFVQIFPRFNAICTGCNREFDAMRGLGAKCPHCGKTYTWSEEEERYYPQPQSL